MRDCFTDCRHLFLDPPRPWPRPRLFLPRDSRPPPHVPRPDRPPRPPSCPTSAPDVRMQRTILDSTTTTPRQQAKLRLSLPRLIKSVFTTDSTQRFSPVECCCHLSADWLRFDPTSCTSVEGAACEKKIILFSRAAEGVHKAKVVASV